MSTLIDTLLNQTLSPAARIEEISWLLIKKGHGTPAQEQEFLLTTFRALFAHEPAFTSFSWEQYQDYNDNYFYFGISSFYVNDELQVDLSSDFTTWVDSEIDWDYPIVLSAEMNQLVLDQPIPKWKAARAAHLDKLWTDYWAFTKAKYAPLKPLTDAALILLNALHARYSSYYFVYTFGRYGKICITAAGIEVAPTDISVIIPGNDTLTHFDSNL